MTEKDWLEYKQLKDAVRHVLHMTVAGGNGGYYADFGPVTFSRLVKLTGFDVKTRKICKKVGG